MGGLDPDEGVQTPASASKMPVWLAWAPYVLAAVILLITRWPVAVTLIIAVSMTQIMSRSGVNLRQQPGLY